MAPHGTQLTAEDTQLAQTPLWEALPDRRSLGGVILGGQGECSHVANPKAGEEANPRAESLRAEGRAGGRPRLTLVRDNEQPEGSQCCSETVCTQVSSHAGTCIHI